MNNRSWSEMGADIRDAVERAVKDADFSRLGEVAKNTVADTVINVSNIVEDAVSNNNKTNYTYTMQARTLERKRAEAEAAEQIRMRRNKYFFKPIGSISGTLYKVFGGIGLGFSSVLTAVFGGLGLGIGGGFWTVFGWMVVADFLFTGMIKNGVRKKKVLQRAQKYMDLAGNNHYVNIEELALHCNKSKKYIIRDIKKMIEDGIFPQGHLDARESCFMLDDKIYKEYLDLEKQRKIQEREQFQKNYFGKTEQSASNVQNNQAQTTEKPKLPPSELEKLVSEGQECISKLRKMNDNIEGEEISAKLFKLENLLKEIFERISDHPEQIPQMQKFMNYYLPTTLKLVAAYEEFDTVSVQGDDIKEAKLEIEKTLDTINSAFAEFLNKLFRDAAYDATTDAQVLKTMLAQEGLTGQNDFENALR